VDIPPALFSMGDIPPALIALVEYPPFLGINLLLRLKDSKSNSKYTISKIPFGTNSSNQQFLA